LKYRSKAVFVSLWLIAISANARAESLFVAARGDLQAALNNAQPGDEIILEAGATFVGPFTLPRKPNVDGPPIVIRTSTTDDQLPAGVRVSPQDAAKMPKLIAGVGTWVLNTEEAAANYMLIGLEIAPAPGYEMLNVVLLGSWTIDGRWTETSVSQLPQHITFDRMYIHGDPVAGSRRGIAMNGINIEVYDSYISDFKQTCCDSQALEAWNGPGPFVIENNYLEAAGENVMFGGGDPSIPGLVSSDIRIRNNHFFKPLRWKPDDPSYEGKNWVVKNLFELKNARNVILDGNVLENNWADDQNGFAILLTPRNPGSAPWSTVENIQITNNLVAHSTSGVNVLGWENVGVSQQAKNILIKDNLFLDIGGQRWGEDLPSTYGYGHGGWFLQVLDGTNGLVIEHNTILESKGVLVADVATPLGIHTGALHTGFVFRNNIVRHGSMGIAGAAGVFGKAALAKYFDSPIIENNVVIGGDPYFYPGNNDFPAAVNDVGFVSASTGDYRLATFSPFKSRATDGKDMGATGSAFNLVSGVVLGGMTATTTGAASLQIGSAEIRTLTGSPSGVAILDYRQNNVLISEAGIPASTPLTKGRISVQVAGAADISLAISNPNDSTVTVSFAFVDDDGQDFGARSFQLPAHGQIARFLRESPFNQTEPLNGTMTLSSTLPVAIVALRGFSSLPVVDLSERVPPISYFPHFADGAGWSTQFTLINPSDSPISGTLTFFDQDGRSVDTLDYSIPSRRSRQFSTDGASAQVRVGSARITASPGSVAPAGAEIVSFKQGGVTVTETAFQSNAAGSAFRMYAETGTGVAIVNSSNVQSRVDLQLTRMDGAPAAAGSLVIPAFGQRALFLDQIMGLDSLDAFKGILRISSADQVQIAVAGILRRVNERGDVLLTTMPTVNEDTPANETAVFPLVVDGSGFTTQFIMFAGRRTEPASGHLQLFSQPGGTLNVTVH
jgi:hypothetical protein